MSEIVKLAQEVKVEPPDIYSSCNGDDDEIRSKLPIGGNNGHPCIRPRRCNSPYIPSGARTTKVNTPCLSVR